MRKQAIKPDETNYHDSAPPNRGPRTSAGLLNKARSIME
jgi:hypothetical protein